MLSSPHIDELLNSISSIETLARYGILPEAEAVTALSTAMEKLNKAQKKFVDFHHDWNERDFLPRTKPRGDGKIVEYYLTHITVNKKRKRLTASSLDDLYKKLYDFYSYSTPTTIRKNATLRDVYEIFRQLRKKDAEENKTISTQTAHYDEVTWNKHFEGSRIADMRIIDISQIIVLNEFKHMTGDGKISKKAFNKAKTLLDAIFDIALSDGIIENNPSRVVPISRLKFKLPEDNSEKVYSKEDRDKIMNYLNKLQPTVYTLAVQLAFCFCLRISELKALTWEDYDSDNEIVLIWHEIIETSRDGVHRSQTDVPRTKTNTIEGRRLLYVSDEAKQILERLREINGDKKYILNSAGVMPISTNHFNEHLRKYCEECGVRYLSSHKIRFYGATELYDAGVDPEQIRRIMGHTTLAMTEHYNRSKGKIYVDKDVWNRIFGKPKE